MFFTQRPQLRRVLCAQGQTDDGVGQQEGYVRVHWVVIGSRSISSSVCVAYEIVASLDEKIFTDAATETWARRLAGGRSEPTRRRTWIEIVDSGVNDTDLNALAEVA